MRCRNRELGHGVTVCEVGHLAHAELDFRNVKVTGSWVSLGLRMIPTTEHGRGNGAAHDKVHALVQLLRNRSYEEIRQRMYDNPPGSAWWTACKTELDIRNSEQTASALLATSRVLERMQNSTEQLERLCETLSHANSEVIGLLEGMRSWGRRLEFAIYVVIGVAVVQMFQMAFQMLSKR